jgi:hypothetical protein
MEALDHPSIASALAFDAAFLPSSSRQLGARAPDAEPAYALFGAASERDLTSDNHHLSRVTWAADDAVTRETLLYDARAAAAMLRSTR